MSDFEGLDNELLAQMREDFLIEAQEILERLGPLLADLERDPRPELITTIFREVHTLKGNAGFVGLEEIGLLAHKLEDLFGALRGGQLPVTAELIDVAYAALALLAMLREDVIQGMPASNILPMVGRLERALTHPPADPLRGADPDPPQEALLPAPTEQTALASRSADLLVGPSASVMAADTTLRVDVATLDTLMVLVGELITARNALLAQAERLNDDILWEHSTAISRLTRQLESSVTTVRLVPVEMLFNRFVSVVRNLARESGKRVRTIIEGGDTPMDRTVSEQMYDSLIHLMRNAIDHGLEPPEERLRVGKAEEGTILLTAERRGEHVILRIADDGRGIDPYRVRRIAVARGLYSEAEVDALTDEQAIRLIFIPGFSTAASVTDLSGRGVGMDVVLQNVRRLRGHISIESCLGRGTTFILQLPLALAILQVLLVTVGGHTYAIPLHFVRETLRLSLHEVQRMQQREVLFIRDTALPVHYLGEWLSAGAMPRPSRQQQRAVIIHLASGDEVLIVDELLGKQQVVIKPLSPYLGAIPGIEGTAILPDGSVTLILDIEGLAATMRQQTLALP
ncbi:MAG: chemotaxis protein CheA [Ardenticatenales bacterium]|nr:chemotaxis protein CheA [Ardenticatenales bacterium]